MKSGKLIILATIVFSLTVTKIDITAQENPPKVLIMGVPQYMFQHGVRIDLDLPTKDYKSWWVISPQYYINVSNLESINSDRYQQLHGYGISLNRKGFLSSKFQDQGVYISGGIGFQHFNMLVDNERWAEVEIDGLKYFQSINEPYHITINKLMTDVVIGYQKEVVSRLYVDFLQDLDFGIVSIISLRAQKLNSTEVFLISDIQVQLSLEE
ncbi:MAG: hypothetical protein HC905_30290 [Bacteroidales bacterium]|nr:hypothetical protein [Bacteroidales bacterium]